MAELGKREQSRIIKRRLTQKERQRKCRLDKQAKAATIVSEDQVSLIGSFQNKRSFGRAVNRVKRSLPQSPNKKAAVIRKIAGELNVSAGSSISSKERGTNEEVEHRVKSFYERDDVSRQAPGKKDFITIRGPLEKTTSSNSSLIHDN